MEKSRGLITFFAFAAALSFAAPDLTLTGSQSAQVSSAYTHMYLYDSSAAAVEAGGRACWLYVHDSARADVDGGTVTTGLWAYDASRVRVYGGDVPWLYARGGSRTEMRGGSVTYAYANDNARLDVFGGRIMELRADGLASVVISGGVVNGLYANGGGNVLINTEDVWTGAGLAIVDHVVVGTGTLFGRWDDLTEWSIDIRQNDTAGGIRIVPEPMTLGLLALGAAALWRRKTA